MDAEALSRSKGHLAEKAGPMEPLGNRDFSRVLTVLIPELSGAREWYNNGGEIKIVTPWAGGWENQK